MATLRDLAKRMRSKVEELPELGNRMAIKVTMTIVRDLSNNTPVDESVAISNWQVNLNLPVTAPIGAFHPGTKGSTQTLSANATVEAAAAVLAGKKAGEKIYLSNVLRYIELLNNGSSTQAPAGYVERSVLIGRLVVRGKI